MILVDSSVWIDYFRGTPTGPTRMLDAMLGRVPLLVGDLIAAEVLQGLRDERTVRRVQQALDAFEVITISDYAIAVQAARNYRWLRARGYTIRKTIDTLIATRCIEDGITLLHADRDFDPFAQALGLRVAFTPP